MPSTNESLADKKLYQKNGTNLLVVVVDLVLRVLLPLLVLLDPVQLRVEPLEGVLQELLRARFARLILIINLFNYSNSLHILRSIIQK